MNVHELMQTVKRDEVWQKFTHLDPHSDFSQESFNHAWSSLTALTPRSVEDRPMILVGEPKDTLDGEICGHYEGDETLYALDFSAWDEWLSFVVDEEWRLQCPVDELMARILWEMTWDGFDPSDVERARDELLNRANEIEHGESLSWEEVKARLEALLRDTEASPTKE